MRGFFMIRQRRLVLSLMLLFLAYMTGCLRPKRGRVPRSTSGFMNGIFLFINDSC